MYKASVEGEWIYALVQLVDQSRHPQWLPKVNIPGKRVDILYAEFMAWRDNYVNRRP